MASLKYFWRGGLETPKTPPGSAPALSLSCEATGSDPIRYQWRRVNGEISSDRTEGVNTSTLTISPVTLQDMDEYYCVASNDLKDESKTAIVAVLSKITGKAPFH